MNINIERDYEAVSRKAARIIAREILDRKEPVLGLPTGETPKGTYSILVSYYESKILDFARVSTFNLDEYYPISGDDPRSFTRYMEERFFNEIDIPEKNVHIPDGAIPREKVEDYCKEYEKKIAAEGGLDLLILGIGENGHIGFNEPGAEFGTRTRLVNLSQETRKANFTEPDQSPDRAITMGIKTIMKSRKILLIATGKRKAKAVKKALTGPVSEENPASILQLHPNITFLLDELAGNLL